MLNNLDLTYFDWTIKEVYAVHIIEKAEGIGNGGAVVRYGKPINLIGHQVVDGRDRTKKSVQTASKGSHISVIIVINSKQAV